MGMGRKSWGRLENPSLHTSVKNMSKLTWIHLTLLYKAGQFIIGHNMTFRIYPKDSSLGIHFIYAIYKRSLPLTFPFKRKVCVRRT